MIEKINNPIDLKKLNTEEINILASEMREGILNRVNKLGGHIGPDLGIVEMTIALHYVFNSPIDKFVFDVSHQCYPHKMLTGRKNGFIGEIDDKISGYFNYKESIHDTFNIGHTSTSVSLALGVVKARDLNNEKYNVITLIGDGSLSGGEAYEGLNNAATIKSNMIIIVNDNEMSIAENQGGLYSNLKLLRDTKGNANNNFFKSIGFDYLYLDEGNDIEKLIEIFNKVKDIDHPIVLHIHTLKGKGYLPAIEDKETYHWHLPCFLNEDCNKGNDELTYEKATTDFILAKLKNDKKIVAINPATPGAVGFSKDFREKMGDNYIDPGICEEHSIAYASGLAKFGGKPVLAILSSFIQRTYDQLSQDLALNSSPATILVFWGGISSADMTHLGVFDIPLISNIPNLVYLAPTNLEEYLKMLEYSIEQDKYPILIRVPFNKLISCGVEDKTDYSILNKYELKKKGSEIAIFGLGDFYHLGLELSDLIEEKLGITPTLINPKFITGIDSELLNELKSNHKIVITLENGVINGGFGEKISAFYGNSSLKVLNYGATKEFEDRMNLSDLYEKYRLKPELILQDIKNII